MLGVSKKETENLCRHLNLCKEGYRSEDLIFHMMGDRNYLWQEDKQCTGHSKNMMNI